jgi:hypothetical protein
VIGPKRTVRKSEPVGQVLGYWEPPGRTTFRDSERA